MFNIIKSEFKKYLLTTKTYIFLGVFLLFYSMFFYSEISMNSYIEFSYTLASCVGVLICILPLLTIKMFYAGKNSNNKDNEEKDSKANSVKDVDLYSNFQNTARIVLGKFISAMCIVVILEILTLMYVAILAFFGKIYFSNILFTLLGFLLLAMSFIACGMFISSMFKNKIAIIIFTLISFITIWLLPSISQVSIDYSLVYNFNTTFQNGIFSMKSVILFLSFILFFTLITIIKLNNNTVKLLNKKINKNVIILGATIIFILLNLGIGKLNIKSKDITAQNLYTLSDKSKELIKNISSDVNIYFIGFADEEATVVFAKQYNEANSKIHIEAIDIAKRQDLATKYGVSGEDIGIIIECGKKYKVLSYQKLHEFSVEKLNYLNFTEQKITNALLDVTMKEKPNIYFITGHGEFNLNTYGELYSLNMYLQNDINNVSTLNLLETYFPERCDLIVIATPQSDYSEKEVETLMNYINNGGNILWLNDATFIDELPNLSKILDYYGVKVRKGAVLEQNPSNVINNSPYLIVPQVKKHQITSKFYNKKSVVFAQATRLETKTAEELASSNITIKEIINSSATSAYFEDVENVNAYEKGPFILRFRIK